MKDGFSIAFSLKLGHEPVMVTGRLVLLGEALAIAVLGFGGGHRALSRNAEPDESVRLLSVLDTIVDAQPMLAPRFCQELAGMKLNAGRISRSLQQ